jgi:hypothetical protein
LAADVDYQRSPVAWFVVLEQARHDRDFERAAEAQRKLRELGVEVRYRPEQPEPATR